MKRCRRDDRIAFLAGSYLVVHQARLVPRQKKKKILKKKPIVSPLSRLFQLLRQLVLADGGGGEICINEMGSLSSKNVLQDEYIKEGFCQPVINPKQHSSDKCFKKVVVLVVVVVGGLMGVAAGLESRCSEFNAVLRQIKATCCWYTPVRAPSPSASFNPC